MNPATLIVNRWLLALPLIAAIVFHAVTLNRWAMAIPAIIAIAIFVAGETNITITSRHTYVAGTIGLIMGMVLPVSNVTSGVLPDIVVGVSTSVLICMALLNVVSGKMPITWVSAWVIVSLSASVPMTRTVSASLYAFLLISFFVAAWQIGVFRFRLATFMQFGLLLVVALSTLAIAAAARRVDTVMLMSAHAMTNNNSMQNVTGLSNNITVRSQESIRLSKRPVMDLSSMSDYLRTKVLDEFNGRQWSTSARLTAQSHSFDTFDENDPSAGTLLQPPLEIVFLNDLGDVLPAPAGTRRMEHAASRITGGWILRGTPETISIVTISDATGQLPTEAKPTADDVLIPDDLQIELGPIAAELTAAVKTNVAKASEIEAFFHQNFEYSLQTDLSGEAHPLVTLVRERRAAYCVYFASAMTVMLRSQGIAARVVTGFAPTEINRLTGRVIVRDRDAHAWVEVWSPAQLRYIAFDPTPTASRLEIIGHPETSSMVASLITAVGSWARRLYLAATREPIRLAGVWLASPWLWLVATFSLLAMGRRYLKRTSVDERPQRDQVDPALRGVYAEYVRSLAQAGITPQSWETDEEIIARLADGDFSSLSESAGDFIARYQASRFGGAELDEQLTWNVALQHSLSTSRVHEFE